MITLKTDNWKLENIEAVLFDKDGTIMDLHQYWGKIVKMRSNEFVKKFNLEKKYYKKICLWMGYSIKRKKLLSRGPVGIVSREEVIKVLLTNFDKYKVNISKQDISELFIKIHKKFLHEMNSYVKILPNVYSFIQKLKENNIKIAIVTADETENAKKCMKLLKLDKYIDIYIGREHSNLPKSCGEHANIAVNLLKVKKENTVCIGDAPMDIIMAKNSQLKAGIGISLGQNSYNELLKHSKYIIRSYKDIQIL